MRLPVRLAIISALLFCCAGLCPRANSQTTPLKKNPDATVSGKVSIKGKPAPGVVVGLRSSQPTQFDPTFKATTDQEGNYRITDVPGGSYVIAPVAPSFVISEVNSSRGQTVVISESENVEGLDFEMVRGGVITGRVRDSEGHSIIEERVTLSPADQRDQRGPVYSVMQGFQTDDRGIYRMFGIRPGRYKVSVGEGENMFYRGAGRGRPSYPTTFYPDVTDGSKATVVEIGEGTEATNIDINLAEAVQGFSVNGRVVDETGKPAANVSIGLEKIVVIDANNTRNFGGGTSARSDIQGEFRLEKLPPGKYSISIYPPPESDLRGEPVTFDILDQDVTGLVIKTSAGASVAGTVVIEGTRDNSVVAALSQSYVAAIIRNEVPNVSSSGRSARIALDGSFRVGGLQAGTAIIQFETMNRVKGLTLARVERDGVVQPNGIQVQNAEHVTGIKLFVTYSNGSIRGVVKIENGTLPPSGRLIVQLTKPTGGPTGAIRPVEADSRGHFLVEGLAAGNYEVIVMAYAPEWRRRPPSAKQLVTVTDGASTDVTVTIDLTPPPGP